MLNQTEQEKLWGLIKPIKTAMMTTYGSKYITARPMAHVNDKFDGTLTYFTHITSEKVEEIARNPMIGLTYADHDKSTYLSITAQAILTQDKAEIDEHWNMFVSAWFPKGKNDPDIGLIKAQVIRAEYWDSTSSTMVQLYEIAKANLFDTVPDMGEHRKLG